MLAALLWLASGAARVLGASTLYAGSGSAAVAAALLDLSAVYPQRAGRQALMAGDGAAARVALRASLERAPFSPTVWLDLAEARLQSGNAEGAAAAATNASRLASTSAAVRWRAAQLHLRAGGTDEGVRELGAVVRLDARRRARVWDLGWAILGDGDAVERTLVLEDVAVRMAYLEYLMGRGRIGAGRRAWNAIRATAPRAWRLDFTDFLLSHQEMAWAWEVWSGLEPGVRVGEMFNGDFATSPYDRGFGWRLGGVDGAVAEITDARAGRGRERSAQSGRRALRVRFRGDGNPTFDRANQVVRVESGRVYRLVASVRWTGITSASPPFLEVRDYRGCEGLVLRTTGFSGTGAGVAALEFTTPRACEAVLVGVRREATERLDRVIGGTLWIDHVALASGRV